MIDLKVLKAKGITDESLKKAFEKAHLPERINSENENERKVAQLVQRIAERVQNARDFNAAHYSLYYALDAAFDASFNQITPTLLATLADKSADDKTVMDSLQSWGMNLNDVTVEVEDPKTPGKNIRKVSVPAFFRVFVPLVASYVKIRWSKLTNDRKMVPLFKYEPAVNNELSRLRCETITARVETMASQYGYFDVMKQWIFKMLHYGEGLMFPVEQWHTEYQLVGKDSPYLGKTEGQYKKVVVKEGLRYHMPHPTRAYYDRAYPAHSMNSDTGVTYAGYWQISRWGEVRKNKDYWNTDSVLYGASAAWHEKNKAYFQNVYHCSIKFPSAEEFNTGVSKKDNEAHLSNYTYSSHDDDTTVILTHHFEKLIPSENGLGDYDCPVWFRIVMAGDKTVIYARPMAYNPLLFMGYDHTEGRTHNPSMSLEVLPFQDQFSNLLTQTLLAVRQNLTNLTFVDTDIVNEDDIKKIENWGERLWRGLNIFRFSRRKHSKALNEVERAVVPHKFPLQDVPGLINSMKVILDTLERVLVMSAQEVGQAASHEQTAEEVRNIDKNTSTRVVFTGTAIDMARDAWKRQIYEALMAYGQDEFYAQVPMDQPVDDKVLEALGFTYEPDQGKAYDTKERRAHLKVKKMAIAYESFVAHRDGQDRANNAEIAKNMVEFFKSFISDPEIKAVVGVDQVIKIANYIGRFAGFPRDFKLTVTNPQAIPPQNMMEQVQQALQQMSQYIEQGFTQAREDTKKAFENVIQVNEQQDARFEQQDAQLNEVFQTLAQIQEAAAQVAPTPVPPGLVPEENLPLASAGGM